MRRSSAAYGQQGYGQPQQPGAAAGGPGGNQQMITQILQQAVMDQVGWGLNRFDERTNRTNFS